MSTRLDKKDIYTAAQLTGISARCDWFIHDRYILKNKDIPSTIFISNYKGYNSIPYFIDTILPTLSSPTIVIIASEDFTFPTGSGDLRANHVAHMQDKIQQFIDHPLIIRIYVENLDTLHPKLTPIPLGIHPVWAPWYTNTFNTDIVVTSNRPILAFCCHRTHAWGPQQFIDRVNVSELAKTVWSDFTEQYDGLPLHIFKEKLLSSKFTICVHGGGIDPSPRAWEALLCGSIPIMQHSTLDAAYSRFPVFYVDEWDISEEKLNTWWDNNYNSIDRKKVLEMLSLDYWWDIIQTGKA